MTKKYKTILAKPYGKLLYLDSRLQFCCMYCPFLEKLSSKKLLESRLLCRLVYEETQGTLYNLCINNGMRIGYRHFVRSEKVDEILRKNNIEREDI